MTYDITLKKVSGDTLGVSQAARRRVFRLSLLFMYVCHKMSLRHQPLLAGLFSMTFCFLSLSFVTLYTGVHS
jgi:hypothetical protein